ncbi:hypothetical protein [Actinoalloteichus caeruleus]|uniref:hypothetical protein n=1 Tax=Actinoalloteichus cyanogriseus TaxID=2893586 RepID=UPI0004AA470F|nr:hypothetical protein [Actinoalloteichus caeruleus]
MNSSAEQPHTLVLALLDEVRSETGLPVTDWVREEHGDHSIVEVCPPDAAGDVVVWLLGQIALVFLDIAEPVEFDLREEGEAERLHSLLLAAARGQVEFDELVGRSASHPYAVRWPGGEHRVTVSSWTWMWRRRMTHRVRRFPSWTGAAEPGRVLADMPDGHPTGTSEDDGAPPGEGFLVAPRESLESPPTKSVEAAGTASGGSRSD